MGSYDDASTVEVVVTFAVIFFPVTGIVLAGVVALIESGAGHVIRRWRGRRMPNARTVMR